MRAIVRDRSQQLLTEALADAMDQDLADVPPREQLEQQHRFSKKFVRRMKRLETDVKGGKEIQAAAGPFERIRSGGGKITDFRRLGAAAKRYSGLAAALVCVIGLAAVVGVMSQSLRMSKSVAFESVADESAAADTAAPEEAWDDMVEEPSAEAAEEPTAESAGDEKESDAADNGEVGSVKGNGSTDEQQGEQEPSAPDWQEHLLLESAKADELVTWHLNMIYDDGSIGLNSKRVLSADGGVSDDQSLYVSPVFEVYYEQHPDEWECIYRTKRTRENYSAATSWDDWYSLGELHMTQAGTYRLVRQVNSYRQVLQLTLDER